MPTIVTRNSSTAAAAPVAGQLVQGELAVNVTDRILYTKDNANNIVTLGRPINIQQCTSAGTSFTWTKPTNASFVLVELLGAGGGGGGGGGNWDVTEMVGGGGGGGSYNYAFFKASDLGSTETVTVGSGGSAGGGGVTSAGSAGGAGNPYLLRGYSLSGSFWWWWWWG